ncbi:hypothetical protein Hanom_Chr07g00595071 [Helianthus anomalus]
MFEGRNLRFTKDFRMCFVMNRLRLKISKTKVFLRAGQMAEFDGCRTKVLSYTT